MRHILTKVAVTTVMIAALQALTAVGMAAHSAVNRGASVAPEEICIETRNTQMLLKRVAGDTLKFVYYGPRLDAADTHRMLKEEDKTLMLYGYPVFGTADGTAYAMQMEHADGNQTLDLKVEGIDRLQDGGVDIRMRDRVYPVDVKLCYRTYPESDMIETWVEVYNGEKKAVRLNRFDSSFLPIEQGDVWVSRLHGDWASESTLVEEPLGKGVLQIKTTDGARGSHYARPEVMVSLDGKPSESHGRTIGAALEWSGNFSLRFDTESHRVHKFFAGALSEPSGYVLESDSLLVTPRVVYTYSDRGKGGVSRNFHAWAKHDGKVHGCDRQRDILLNSWEGVYLDIKEPVIEEMMRNWKDLGGELFVLDDGWFGDKYPRNVDDSALGDWRTDNRKLPNGIDGLIRKARKNGLKFGIWIEPEFTNPRSVLYEQHPDWVLANTNRPLRYGRGGTQLILDLTNPEVQDFIVGTVDSLLTEHPEIAYVKWDCNTFLLNYGSQSLPANRQANIYFDYHKNLLNVLERIRARHPDVAMQNCGGGGGRYNYGLMPYFDEYWVSDNTDALQRIYIQWGSSMFYPPHVMGQHVSASPSHQTGRLLPMKFRFDVAMSGRLGVEMLPSAMTDTERQFARQAIATYKEIRPLIQNGEQHRLLSPYGDSGMASIEYLAPDGGEALLFAYKVRHYQNQVIPRFRLEDLDPDATYMVQELNVYPGQSPRAVDGGTFTGRYLMEVGLRLEMSSDFSSALLRLSVKD